MAVTIRIGTCGFGFFDPGVGWRERHRSRLEAFSAVFPLMELDRPFYSLPRLPTALRWRQEVRPGFEFTLKAWQVVTHPAGSPTYRRHPAPAGSDSSAGYGFFRPVPAVFEAWERTRQIAQALQTRVCVFQSPPGFGPTEDNERNLRGFFGSIDRGGLTLAWEPRGRWHGEPRLVARLCDELGLVHVTDLLRRPPLSAHPVAYVRLHGLNPQEYRYEYDYSPAQLEELASRLVRLAQRHEPVYCLFNNTRMAANARRLAGLLGLPWAEAGRAGD